MVTKPKDKKLIHLSIPKPQLLIIFLFISFWLISHLIFFSSSPNTTPIPSHNEKCDPDIAPIYIIPLPSRFNSDLLHQCHNLSPYTNMCPHVANNGLGQPLSSSSSSSWHATHQFIAELIFHARVDTHPCRTRNPNSAQLFLLPFYAGLYGSSQLSQTNLTIRDALALDFASLLPSLPTWPRRHGRDHFLVVGRTSWDFMRPPATPATTTDFGANLLLLLPETQNISVLTVERIPNFPNNHFAIPYPSYFHPSFATELNEWRAAVLNSPRTHLLAFVGGPREANVEKAAVRASILRQCTSSPSRCIQVECRREDPRACHDPERVMDVMRRAEFCLQPPGDSFTRRAVFDAVLAGCVPVFFSEHTAYTQYGWYEAGRPEEWSVLLGPERWDRIEEELDRIAKPVVARMRERVVEMIPRVTYAHPNASGKELGFRDAVDVALVELTKIVRRIVPQV